MDKKNTTIGVLLLVAAFASLYFGAKMAPAPSPAAPELAPQTAPMPTAGNAAPSPGTVGAPASSPSDATFAAVVRDNAGATVTTLANDVIEVRFTDFGGAIRDVAFRTYSAEQNQSAPYVFNEVHADPLLAFTDFPGLDRSARYTLVSATATEVVYRAIFENRLEVTRRYTVRAPGDTSADPYRIKHETTIRNLSDATAPLPRATLSLGTASLVNVNDVGQYLNAATFDGEDTHFTDRGELEGGGFLSWIGMRDGAPKPFVDKPGVVNWAAVKNQFFASVYTPTVPGVGLVARRVELPPFAGSTRPNIGLTAVARFELPVLAPGASTSMEGELYVGPKEYRRLAKFDGKEDRVMQYDRYFFNRIFLSGYVAPFMNTLMNWTHGMTGNWGVAIILMTLILKIVTLPFTLAASRSAKRMQKLQPLMQAVREKHKDNPQKLNQATIELFKEHKVNPMGGCLPVLITIPLFVGFFTMLQGTAELRFQGFLWAFDLSAPDTVFRLFGLPLNIMPLLMGATMVYQMKLTPMAPGAGDAAQMQATMMKIMPIVFTLICYNFASALALYSTVNGVFTIIQQVLVNKFTKDVPLASETAPVRTGGNPWKPVKNVTPKKK
ncbi:MAG TPA: YidC/Oxa1 family insertase periplasmic-domain containing protein [Opitutaceae bacterium]